EGQAPSTVNDSARAMMAAASKYRDDVAGAIATAGTGAAYTLASFQVFDTLAHMDGAMIAFTPHAGNAGACTLNVDALRAKPLRSAPATELLAGMLVAGTPYAATYYNVSGEWILRGLTGAPGIPSAWLCLISASPRPRARSRCRSGRRSRAPSTSICS